MAHCQIKVVQSIEDGKTVIGYKEIAQRAWPLILANAAVPLLGLVDTAVIGNLGTVADLGAIALGALIFSFVYWGFGFLRMGTTGFVARASGAEDFEGVRAVLGRSLLLALTLGLILVILQWPIQRLAFSLLSASNEVEALAYGYFSIRIWGAPATLASFALMGYLIGLGESRALLRIQLLLNGLNIGLDVLFAGYFRLGAEGIALGTVIAEWITVIYALQFIVKKLRIAQGRDQPLWPVRRIMDQDALLGMLTANFDIMIRTLLLVFSFAFFTDQSARFGDSILAANHLLLQIIAFTAFFLDGFAFVVESLAGKAMGAGNRHEFEQAVRRTSEFALVTAASLALGLLVFGGGVIGLLTDLNEVQSIATDLQWLAALYVLLSFVAFQLDGIFIGVSFTREMRHAAIISLAVFLAAWMMLIDEFGVVGLWWSMIIYVVARALALLLFYPRLLRAIPTAT